MPLFPNKNTLKFFLFACLMASFALFTFQSACAESEVFAISGQEKAVFSYFKLTGKSPDYERWIMHNPAYKGLVGKKKEQFLVSESLRLGGGYGHYNIEYDPLIITIDINAKIVTPTETEPSAFEMEFLGWTS